MSVDVLQDKIRKTKSALMVDLTLPPEDLPEHLLREKDSPAAAYLDFCRELLTALKGIVPAVRVSFSAWSLLGADGLKYMRMLLKEADAQGFYLLLDAPEMASPRMAAYTAKALSEFPFDGVVIPTFSGTDIIRPFLNYCGEKKDVFCVVRTANKSAPELQDLLTGSRLVHLAAADRVSRFSSDYVGKFGYSRLAVLAAASSAESLRSLRGKYPGLFILADGLDYPGANMKNASLAFDKLGRGAVVCAGTLITCAWKQENSDGTDFAAQAAAAAEKLRKNLLRYITIL